MTSLASVFAGLPIRSPFIVSSSGLTNKLKGVELANHSGAGAVILKSLFEEQIVAGALSLSLSTASEELEYLESYGTYEYLHLVAGSKKFSDIPVIASINCYSKNNWLSYAKEIEASGADALELNMMIISAKEVHNINMLSEGFYKNYPLKGSVQSERFASSMELEKNILESVSEVTKNLKIPVVVKLPPNITGLHALVSDLSKLGVKAVTLFNRINTPDFNIHTGEIDRSIRFSSESDIFNTLRWTYLLSDDVKTEISASGGVYNSDAAIKLLLAGASSVQLCSLLYKDGFSAITKLNSELENWCTVKNYSSINAFRGKLDQYLPKKIFTREQYMKLSNAHE